MKRKYVLILCAALSLTSFLGCLSKPSSSNSSNHSSSENHLQTSTAAVTSEEETTQEITTEGISEVDTTEEIPDTEETTTETEDAQEEQNVEWLKVSEHYLDEYGDIISDGTDYEYTYDEHGNLVTVTWSGREATYENIYDGDQLVNVSYDSSITGSTVLILYAYDENGNLFVADRYSDGIVTGTPSSEYAYTYDDKNRMISQTHVTYSDEFGEILDYYNEYEYDDNDNIIRKDHYSDSWANVEAGTPGTYVIYSYDEDNKPTTTINYNGDGSVFSSSLYYYDDPEAACVCEYYVGNRLSSIEYYNEDKDLLKRISVDEEGTYITDVEEEYYFDENGYKHTVIYRNDHIYEYVFMPFYYDKYAPLHVDADDM